MVCEIPITIKALITRANVLVKKSATRNGTREKKNSSSSLKINVISVVVGRMNGVGHQGFIGGKVAGRSSDIRETIVDDMSLSSSWSEI